MSRVKCPGQDPRFLKAQDIAEVKCPTCGGVVEFWPDEFARKCAGCGQRLANPQNSMKCLAWCRHAAQCLAAIRGEGSTSIGALREELIERMRGAFEDDGERIDRTLTVLGLAEDIGRQVGADPLVLVPAAILHDVDSAADVLADIALPQAVKDEITEVIKQLNERERIDTPNGAALFDAILMMDLKQSDDPFRSSLLPRRALTAAGRRMGAAYLAQ